jgi:hypothetical protein
LTSNNNIAGTFLSVIGGATLHAQAEAYCALVFTTTGVIVVPQTKVTSKFISLNRGIKTPERTLEIQAAEFAMQEPSDILQNNQDSFLVLFSDIESICIKRGGVFSEWQLDVLPNKGDGYHFTYKSQLADNTPKLLREVIPDKVVHEQ